MADTFPTTITKQIQNNQPNPVTVSKGVIQVVIADRVVVDPKDLNPGVINTVILY